MFNRLLNGRLTQVSLYLTSTNGSGVATLCATTPEPSLFANEINTKMFWLNCSPISAE